MEWKDIENMMERYECLSEEIMNGDETLYLVVNDLELQIQTAYESGQWPQELWESSKYWDDWKDWVDE